MCVVVYVPNIEEGCAESFGSGKVCLVIEFFLGILTRFVNGLINVLIYNVDYVLMQNWVYGNHKRH